MRIAARTSSGDPDALEDSPAFDAWWADLKRTAATVDWTPWLIIALGAFLRLFLLAIKPPHFDEGINGWFVDQLVKNGYYRYDPTNYHGPLHFYLLFLSESLLGRNLWALRLPVVIGSILSIWLTLKFEPFVGRNVSRLAALAMAVSPGFIFYGRYAIHEVWLLLFSMMFILGLIGLWRKGTPGYLWCTGMGVAGMILTKETYIIHLGCAALALPVTWISHKLRRAPDAKPVKQTWDAADVIIVTAVGVIAIVFFYSGTFFHWSGVKGLYETFEAWFKTGENGNGHEKPWPYWLKLIARYEWPVAIGLAACAACQLFKNIALRYIAVYGVGTLAAYSIVHYKTPWCVISIIWPFLFLFGAGVLLIPLNYRRVTSIAAALVLAESLGHAIWLNYFRCTTDTEPYVYVQTYNDVWRLTKPLLKLANRNPGYYHLTGHMIRTSAYPLPWMLGDFPRIGYYEHDNLPDKVDADFLLVQEDRIAEIEAKLHDSYITMPLRIRSYQDTSKLYLSPKYFQQFYHRAPDFIGKPAR
jgi:uncharacterized protein (TIGR03663 family)